MEKDLKQQQTNILKIVLFGTESSKKEELAQQLAIAFNTVYTPTFFTKFLNQNGFLNKEEVTQEDILDIAKGQILAENESLIRANQLLFCSSSVLEFQVFSEINFKSCTEEVRKAARKNKYDLFLFVNFTELEKEENQLQKAVYQNALIQHNKPYLHLSGSLENHLQQAKKWIQQLILAQQLGFNSFDFISILKKEISIEKLNKQHHFFNHGIPIINIDRPAVLNDGIESLTPEEAVYHAAFFDEKKKNLKLKKFVPASGAASRMFKFLLEFIHDFDEENETINGYINRKKDKNLALFIFAKDKFPFYKEIMESLHKMYPNFDQLQSDQKEFLFIKTILSHPDYNFSNKPKGILPFHKYPNHTATAIEEHLQECIAYATTNGKSNLHFTVSKEHIELFQKEVTPLVQKFQSEKNIEITVSYSIQNPATDVVALDHHNKPFREKDDSIVFRPGGHGALIENLNSLNSDIVFIKNIDNVIQNHLEQISLYKKALAGILLKYQSTIFGFLKQLATKDVSNELLHEIENFANNNLKLSITEGFSKYTKESKIEYLFTLLHRPIRVCGMVKNEGEPGGGPFWIKNTNGTLSLQIIEASQIADNQQYIAKKATHFNPVDLVCGIKDYQGQAFDLLQFVDENTGFIVEKNKNGKKIKAYELPGLWNGAMANWTTIFVEVPLVTFSPVKTVNDLLKTTHQSANG